MKKNDGSILKALASLKLTVALLFCIVALCLVGTVFPQGGDSLSSGHGWASRFPSMLSPFDIFRSIWFMAAGFLLCVNLALCMKKRLNLRKRNLLMLLMHGGILLVIAGYATGSMGLDGFVEIPEGASVSRVELKQGGSMDLGFSVRCDRFTVDYYENGMPREYVSDLSFMAADHRTGRAQLKVNHPARNQGISFYQESFRQTLAAVVVVSDGQTKAALKAREGDVIPLPALHAQARVVKVWDDLMNAGPAVKLLIESPSGTRFLWIFQHISTIKSRMPGFFEMAPEFDQSVLSPYTFSCELIEATYITGIGVRRDPGALLAGIGGTLFLVSLLLVQLTPLGRRGSQAHASGMQTARAPDVKDLSGDTGTKTKTKKIKAARA